MMVGDSGGYDEIDESLRYHRKTSIFNFYSNQRHSVKTLDHYYSYTISMQLRASDNKLASLEATLVRNSAQRPTHLLTGVKCRATSVAKNKQKEKKNKQINNQTNTKWRTATNSQITKQTSATKNRHMYQKNHCNYFHMVERTHVVRYPLPLTAEELHRFPKECRFCWQVLGSDMET